jgi:hypothetical protein
MAALRQVAAATREDEARMALWRRAHPAIDPKVMAAARIAIRRHARVDAAGARLQAFLDRLHAGLREQKLEALEQRDYGRAKLIDLEIDRLYREFDEMARGLAEDLR